MRCELELRIAWLERACNGREERERKRSDGILAAIAKDVVGWETVVTYSKISMPENAPEASKKISVVYRHDSEHDADFYDRNDMPIRLSLRADEYWQVCRAIIKWYRAKSRKWKMGV